MIKIGLIESDSNNRQLLKSALENADFSQLMFVLPDGRHAEENIIRHRPDVLILDDAMPVIDGIEVLKFIQNAFTDPLYIIYLTYQDNYLFHEYVRSLGMNCLVIKPYSAGRMVERLRTLDEILFHRKTGPVLHAPFYSGALSSSVLYENHSTGAEEQAENLAAEFLQNCGVSQRQKGFYYLCRCVSVLNCLGQPRFAVTKDVYPAVAKMSSTSVDVVESAIRSALKNAWNRSSQNGAGSGMCNFFNERPKNAEFIQTMYNNITSAQTRYK